MTEPSFVQDTLDWCNERRAEIGKKPLAALPKGERSSAKSCPCGKASGLRVFCSFFLNRDDETEELPRSVSEFTLAFDGGDLPQYDLNPETA